MSKFSIPLPFLFTVARTSAFPNKSWRVIHNRYKQPPFFNKPTGNSFYDTPFDIFKMSSSSSSPSSSDDRDIMLWKWATHQNESFHYFDKREAEEIRSTLLDWYRKNRRKLPWRGDAPPYDGSTAGMNDNSSSSAKKDTSQKSITSFFNNTSTSKKRTRTKIEEEGREEEEEEEEEGNIIAISPYTVWVSEIMLQQTRVEAVIPYYLKWMKKFPTVHDLAAASEDEVNSHWAGLGFYRRARMLHKGAKFVVNELDGVIPSTVDELMKISGIGRYTASAIASIAFNTCVPVVDGNVCRLLSRLTGVANHIKAPVFKDTLGWKLAEQIVMAGDGLHAGEVNQAMMELGATYCAPSSTGIDDRDPLKEFYLSTKIGTALQDQICSNSIPMNEYTSNALAVRGDKHCALCDPDGISMVIDQIVEDLDNNEKEDNAAIIGHANFPMAPPKKAKREEVLAIAALFVNSGTSGGGRWLMVRRPKGGLLAGQWEFPSECVWSSSNNNSTKHGKKTKATTKTDGIEVPVISLEKRRETIIDLLNQYNFNCDNGRELSPAAQLWSKEAKAKRICTINDEKPIEHIFSHVRHTMYVEFCEVEKLTKSMKSSIYSDNSFFLRNGREYKLMSADDMKNVGITSAIKKILTAVEKNRSPHPPKRRKTSK